MKKGERIIIVGGVASGTGAAAEARRTDPTARITLIDRGGDVSYGACEIPMYLGDEIEDASRLVRYSPTEFAAQFDLEVHILSEITALDVENRTIEVVDGQDGKTSRQSFDKLILATGADAVVPPTLRTSARNAFVLRSLEHARHLKEHLERTEVRHAVIVGAGYVGVEVAEAFVARGIRATVLDGGQGPLSSALEPDMVELVRESMQERGVSVRSERAESLDVSESGFVRGVRTLEGEVIECDLLVVAAGIAPNNSVAAKAGLKIGSYGGLIVDEGQKTSAPAIWACGDCVELRCAITGRPVWIPLALNAFLTGRVAGQNAARRGKGQPARMRTVVPSLAATVFDQEMAMAGLTLAEARLAGFEAECVGIRHRVASGLLGGGAIHVRLVGDRASGRLLGGQVFGARGSAMRINSILSTLRTGGTAQDLADLDFIYSPRISPAKDAIWVAARKLADALGVRQAP